MLEVFYDFARQNLVDFAMAGYWLGFAGVRIVVDIVACAVP